MEDRVPWGDMRVGAAFAERYVFEEKLGEGGMGLVCKARERVLERPVAIKFLRGQGPDDEGRERFLREGRLAAALNHPNIVAVFDYGVTADTCYLVYQHVEGESLEGRLRRVEGPLDTLFVVDLATAILSALAEAHGRGIVHRDVKPENVLLATSAFETSGSDLDLLGWIRVTDFGIAKVLAGDGVQTKMGVILGTPAYMAPEQCTEEGVDGRADLYALGCVLYRCIAGCLPVDGAPMDVLTAHLRGSFPPLAVVAPDAPQDLVAVVQRALARRPDDRWPSAVEMGAAVRRVRSRLLGGTVPDLHERRTRALAAPGASSTRAVAAPPAPSGRRRRIGWGFLGGALLAALLLFLVALPWFGDARGTALRLAVVDGVRLRVEWRCADPVAGGARWQGSGVTAVQEGPRRRHVADLPPPPGGRGRLELGAPGRLMFVDLAWPSVAAPIIALGEDGTLGWTADAKARLAFSLEDLDGEGGAPIAPGDFVGVPAAWARRGCWFARERGSLRVLDGAGRLLDGTAVLEERWSFDVAWCALVRRRSELQGWTALAEAIMRSDLANGGGRQGVNVDWVTSDAGEAWRELSASIPWLKARLEATELGPSGAAMARALFPFRLAMAAAEQGPTGASDRVKRFLELRDEIEGALLPFVRWEVARLDGTVDVSGAASRGVALLEPLPWKRSLWFASNSRWVRGNGRRGDDRGGPARWVGLDPAKVAVPLQGVDRGGLAAWIWGNRIDRAIFRRVFRRGMNRRGLHEGITRHGLEEVLVAEALSQGHAGLAEGLVEARPWLATALGVALAEPNRWGISHGLVEGARRRLAGRPIESREAFTAAMQRLMVQMLGEDGVSAEALQGELVPLLKEASSEFLSLVNRSPENPEVFLPVPGERAGLRGRVALELDVAGLTSGRRIVVAWDEPAPMRLLAPMVVGGDRESYVVRSMLPVPPGEKGEDLDDPRPPWQDELRRLRVVLPADRLPPPGELMRLHLLNMSPSDIADCLFLRGVRIVEVRGE